jgi:hypothetical protein
MMRVTSLFVSRTPISCVESPLESIVTDSCRQIGLDPPSTLIVTMNIDEVREQANLPPELKVLDSHHRPCINRVLRYYLYR